MSDHYQIVAFPEVTAALAPARAERLLGWMFERRALDEARIPTDPFLRKQMAAWLVRMGLDEAAREQQLDEMAATHARRIGHAPGVRASDLVESDGDEFPSDGLPDFRYGCEVGVRPTVHHDLNLPAASTCPGCGQIERDRAWWQGPLGEAAAAWSQTGAAPLVCAACGVASDLRAWSFEPASACAHLALRFGRWPLIKPSVLRELGVVAGSRAVVVRETI